MSANSNHYDVVIIGTGAGGGTLAYHLAGTGKRILLLERGDYLRRETANWDTKEVFTDARYKAHETWLDREGKPFHPGIHYYVGGNTKVYGSALLRFREEDFGTIQHYDGLSPAWPISYNDIEPYYTMAEHLYEVHGERGADPTEPPASAPYSHPAVSNEPRMEELYTDLRRIGHKPFPLPLGIRLNEKNSEGSLCIRCATCDGFPCMVDAKCDAHTTCVRPALAEENVTLITRAMVQRLETDPTGREVRSVHVEVDGVPEVFSGDVVVVSAGAINSALLLLRSASEQHPNGLANSSDMVGRNYMCHNNSAFLAISKRPNPTVFQKTIGLNDFYFGDDEFSFPMGHIQMLGKSNAEMLKGDAPSFAPGMTLEFLAHHAIDFWLTTEDLPDPENRVTINAEGNVQLSYTPNNLEPHNRLVSRLKGMLAEIGCDNHLIPCTFYLGKKIGVGGTAHQCGTVRFGEDPATSVLDVNCKAHDLDNLYVVDGSFFPSSTSVNPALTIMANAMRVGDHLIEKMGLATSVHRYETTSTQL
jgi:choline dehydrogenase-like flavoprotein